MGKNNFNKKAVIIIASKDFKDEEYFVTKEILEKSGIEVKTASNRKNQALGINGGEVNIDFIEDEIKIEDFDIVIFIGGPGTLKNLDNEISYKVARETLQKGKILASICISPIILAKAQVLKEKKATVWTSVLDKSAVKILEINGAHYKSDSVVSDGNIITADGPSSVRQFAEKILKKLSDN